MDHSNQEVSKKSDEVKTFPVPLALGGIKENIIINTLSEPSKKELINKAIKFHLNGNIKQASKYYKYCIHKGFNDQKVFSNYGIILKDLGNLKEAEILQRKAIEINPDFAEAHSNLGNILSESGKLQEAELSIRRAIEINPYFAKAYYALSLLKYSDFNKILKDQLFSKKILNKQSLKDQTHIYFARANFHHKDKNYKESSQYLKLANKLKLIIYPSTPNKRIYKTKVLLAESEKNDLNKKDKGNYPQSIFIVGMPRSGSTLLESILSMNANVDDLGEINTLERSFLEMKKCGKNKSLTELYLKRINNRENTSHITTNKWLYNYQYAGIISSQILNSKVIHCYRNPLDNILSIYRTHFTTGNEYSSSLVDCAKIYLDQEEIMTEYKNKFRSTIYDFNYDLLVSNPNKEIKSLISWLGWQWDDSYLFPHLNQRSVSTASNIQVRFPINSNSIGGWKNYKEMLEPAIEILTQHDIYKDLTS